MIFAFFGLFYAQSDQQGFIVDKVASCARARENSPATPAINRLIQKKFSVKLNLREQLTEFVLGGSTRSHNWGKSDGSQETQGKKSDEEEGREEEVVTSFRFCW